MNAADARTCYQRMLAVWPAAKAQHGPDTVGLWLEELERHPLPVAVVALEELRLAESWFPSVAAFHSAVLLARQAQQERRQVEALEGPRDPRGKERLAEILGSLKENRQVITAKDLDAAKVQRWRQRLEDARRDDEEHATHRKAWDVAWAQIRSEFRAARVGDTPQ